MRNKKGLWMLKREGHIYDLARAGNLDAVKEKIESDGFDPKDKNSYGETLLHYAARSVRRPFCR